MHQAPWLGSCRCRRRATKRNRRSAGTQPAYYAAGLLVLLVAALQKAAIVTAAAAATGQPAEAASDTVCAMPVLPLTQRLRQYHQHAECQQQLEPEDALGEALASKASISNGHQMTTAATAAKAGAAEAASGGGTAMRQLARSMLDALQQLLPSKSADDPATGSTAAAPDASAPGKAHTDAAGADQHQRQRRGQRPVTKQALQQALAAAVHMAEQAAEPRNIAAANVSTPLKLQAMSVCSA